MMQNTGSIAKCVVAHAMHKDEACLFEFEPRASVIVLYMLGLECFVAGLVDNTASISATTMCLKSWSLLPSCCFTAFQLFAKRCSADC